MGSRALVSSLAVAVVTLVIAIQAPPTSATSAAASIPLSSPTFVNATLNESTDAVSLGDGFWGTTVSAEAPITSNTSAYLSSVGNPWVVWPGGALGDAFDYHNGTIHQDTGGNDSAATNASTFAAWCKAQHCDAIVQVPGEIDSPSTAAAEVEYIEQDLSFYPAYWEIGNEPARWTHFAIPWAKWNGFQVQEPTALQYARLVQSYVAAMRAVDPQIRVIGFPGFGKGEYGEAEWISDVVSINGPNISAVAIHVYPDGDGPPGGPNLGHFLSTIDGTNKGSLLYRVPIDEQAIASACATCHIALFVTELGSEVRYGTDSSLVEGFPDTLYIAGEIIEAIDLKIPNVDYYALSYPSAGSWFNLTGPSRPVFQLYSELLSRLGPQAYPVTVNATNGSASVTNLYAVATDGGVENSTALFVDNANLTSGIEVPPSSISGLANEPTEEWTWNSSSPEPVTTFWPNGLPSSVRIPALSLALMEASPQSLEPVLVQESGLAPGTRWFAQLGTTVETTAMSTLTFFEAPGERTLTPEGPIVEYSPTVRFTSSAASVVNITHQPITLNVSFVEQAYVNVSSSPAGSGTASPASQWWDVSTNMSLDAEPESGYTFSHWSGAGAGSYTGPGDPVALEVRGPVTEVADFGGGFVLAFEERGLPTGMAWSVALQGQSSVSYDSSIQFERVNGTYPFAVPALAGYSPSPSEGTITVEGAELSVTVEWSPNGTDRAPAQFAVTFQQSGLPAGELWWVRMDDVTTTSTGSTLVTEGENGTNLFAIGSSGGFIAEPGSGSVFIGGEPLNLTVTFGTETYEVEFVETGLAESQPWSVILGNSEVNSTKSSIELTVPNGTYAFHIEATSGYESNVTSGSVLVRGTGTEVTLHFSLEILGTGSPTPLEVPPTWLYVGAGVGGAGILVAWLVLRRRRRDVDFRRAPLDDEEWFRPVEP